MGFTVELWVLVVLLNYGYISCIIHVKPVEKACSLFKCRCQQITVVGNNYFSTMEL